jgi:hypothetical protein
MDLWETYACPRLMSKLIGEYPGCQKILLLLLLLQRRNVIPVYEATSDQIVNVVQLCRKRHYQVIGGCSSR